MTLSLWGSPANACHKRSGLSLLGLSGNATEDQDLSLLGSSRNVIEDQDADL